MTLTAPSSPLNFDVELTVDKLSCTRGERCLFDKLSFTVSAGQLVHITGPNGCGKSSLLRIICGLSETESGTVQWQDQAISQSIDKAPDYFSSLAYIGHKDGLKNELTAFENLLFYQQLNCSTNKREIDEFLHQLDILNCADLPAYKLSFGQRRRLAFARLLVKPYKLWILDEPFTGIDTQGHQLIEQLCEAHLKNNGMILITNHGHLANTGLSQYLTELPLESVG